MMFQRKPDVKVQRLERKLLDLQAKLEAKDRQIAVLQAEIESMAGVIARDRQRTLAECASYARQRAEAEGIKDEFNRESFGGSP